MEFEWSSFREIGVFADHWGLTDRPGIMHLWSRKLAIIKIILPPLGTGNKHQEFLSPTGGQGGRTVL